MTAHHHAMTSSDRTSCARNTAWTEQDHAVVRKRSGQRPGFPASMWRSPTANLGFTVRGKRFAWLLVDHHGDGRLALVVKARPAERSDLGGARTPLGSARSHGDLPVHRHGPDDPIRGRPSHGRKDT